MHCAYCKNFMFTNADHFGSNGQYCRLECWFQSSADEYKKAYDALMAVEHGGDGRDVLAELSDFVIAEYGDPYADDCEGESFDTFMLRTVYQPAWARGEYPDLGDM